MALNYLSTPAAEAAIAESVLWSLWSTLFCLNRVRMVFQVKMGERFVAGCCFLLSLLCSTQTILKINPSNTFINSLVGLVPLLFYRVFTNLWIIIVLMWSTFPCKPDSAVLNQQGDKGEAGAAGRDVSWTKSPFYYLLVFSVCFHPVLYRPVSLVPCSCINPSFLDITEFLFPFFPLFLSVFPPSSLYLSLLACSDIDIGISLTAETISFSEATFIHV